MGIQIRKTGEKFYAPNRDVTNWFRWAVGSAISVTYEQMRAKESETPSLQEIQMMALAKCLAETTNDAFLAGNGTIADVIGKRMADLVGNPACGQFALNFFATVLGVFIVGARDSSDAPDLPSGTQLERAMACTSLLSILSEETRAKVIQELRRTAAWNENWHDIKPTNIEVLEHGNAGDAETAGDGQIPG